MAVASDDRRRCISDADGEAAARAGGADDGPGERRLTPLERALRERIQAEGPLSVEAYMEACNTYYYATRDPLGAAGDFTTAPEISQMFGELVGAALADCWTRAGAPGSTIYAELGPGRGTLAADALRVLRNAGFEGTAHLVETSPALRAAQASRVPDAQWHKDIRELPSAPLLLVANEFFDALPVQQWIAEDERAVRLDGGELAFTGTGSIRERSPVRDASAGEVARQLAAHGGVGLIVDYGHAASAAGDTLQAVRNHQFADVLANPGESDLTAHVDFEALTASARAAGATVSSLVTQGEWLERLGISARAAALASAHPGRAEEIELARRRLCDPDQMGDLFKVLAISGSGWPFPHGLD